MPLKKIAQTCPGGITRILILDMLKMSNHKKKHRLDAKTRFGALATGLLRLVIHQVPLNFAFGCRTNMPMS